MNNGFVWHELMTTDLPAAQRFYADVAGWTIEDAAMPGMTYLLGRAGGDMVAGLMGLPSTDAAPGWLGYVGGANVDATAEALDVAGGTVHRPPEDIPGVGRFAVVADPQGAVFALFSADAAPPPADPTIPGRFVCRRATPKARPSHCSARAADPQFRTGMRAPAQSGRGASGHFPDTVWRWGRSGLACRQGMGQ
jgi:predicted enzyme related to lactoylglutathione lyase